jgi:carboxypeptidase C (cathepsin A)
MVVSGEFDLNCNFIGTLRLLESNSWLGRAWNTATRALWLVGGEIAGEYFNIDRLHYIIVRNCGHMVPTDVPVQALDMLRRFLNEESFIDHALPSDGMHTILYI